MWEFLKIIATGGLPALVLGWYLRRIALVHSERSKVVTELYARLDRSIVAMEKAASIQLAEGERQPQIETVFSTCNDLRCIMQENRILFRDKLCQSLDDLWIKLKDAATELQNSTDPIQSNAQKINSAHQARVIIQTKLPILREQIELECRRLIGTATWRSRFVAWISDCGKLWTRR